MVIPYCFLPQPQDTFLFPIRCFLCLPCLHSLSFKSPVFFFSMEWFKFTSFSYLQLLLTVDLDVFLRYRMSHQDLFSVHQTTYATLLKHLKLRFSIVYFYHCYFGSLLLFILNSSYWIQDQVSGLVGVVCVKIFWSRHVTHIEPLSFCTLFRFLIVFFFFFFFFFCFVFFFFFFFFWGGGGWGRRG